MDINTLENIREAVHASSLGLLFVVILVASIGLFKPGLLRGIFKEFAERKFILAGAVFISLLCGTVFTATQDTSRSYESSRAGTSNTAIPLEQPNRQVYGQSTSQTEEVTSTNNQGGNSGETLGASRTNQTQQNTNVQPTEKPQENRSVSSNNSASQPQTPASETNPAPPSTPPEKECKLNLLGRCIL